MTPKYVLVREFDTAEDVFSKWAQNLWEVFPLADSYAGVSEFTDSFVIQNEGLFTITTDRRMFVKLFHQYFPSDPIGELQISPKSKWHTMVYIENYQRWIQKQDGLDAKFKLLQKFESSRIYFPICLSYLSKEVWRRVPISLKYLVYKRTPKQTVKK